MQKTYQPQEVESSVYNAWESRGYFKPSGQGDPYCIMLPPPNVTGSLHMGHGFQDALMDALIRYHRMCGQNTLWQPGVDHAGIATQMVVERQLLSQGQSRHDLGREKFLEKVWEWKDHSGNKIAQQMRRIGASPDWSRSRFTMDDDLCELVRKNFVQLYDEGLIYRGKRLVNWDPVLHTAVSDLEVANEEEAGFLWHFRYPLSDGSEYVVIATTRPETMLGDTAVAVHPEDERYKHLIGKNILLPLVNREIPIIADDYVDPEFGTGCVKITPAHDFNDYEMGIRHKLEQINILTIDAKLNENTPKQYQGLDRFEAREKIVEDLRAQDLLEKIENHTLKVPRGDRSKAVLEPYLTNQWFVKIQPLAEPAIKAVENGDIKFIPENWAKTYFQWMYNIQDWCISRQLWWGHRIPAWYDEAQNIYVGESETHVREKYKLADDFKLVQDEDVLDTWFSSAFWPFSTLDWPSDAMYKTFYPTSVLVTGFDIIFFWVARMIMMGIKFTGNVPFHEVYVTGLVRDPDGQKMSKSKGNVLDPLDLIDGIDLESLVEKRISGLMQPEMAEEIAKHTREQFPEGIQSYGADALRFTFCSLASYGRNIRFDFGRIEGYRNFCNKLWNATRYVLQRTECFQKTYDIDIEQCNLPNRWIFSRLQKTIQKTHVYFKEYRFDLLAQTLYDFAWHEYCDWFLELSKSVLLNDNADEKEKYETQYVLIVVLENLLRLLHPIIPFVTEHLWQSVAPLLNKDTTTIMRTDYPAVNLSYIDDDIENDLMLIQQFVLQVRNIRGEMSLSPSKLLKAFLQKGTERDKIIIEKYKNFIMNLAGLDQLEWIDDVSQLKAVATGLVGELEILIPLEGLIDVEEEIARLKKAIVKVEHDFKQSKQKLSNEKFVSGAPEVIVNKEKERLVEAELTLNKLQEKLQFFE